MALEDLDGFDEAHRALSRLVELADGFHPEHKLAAAAVEMKLYLQLAQRYLQDYSTLRVNGAEPDDALVGALSGEPPLSEAAVAAMKKARASRLQ